MNRAAGIATLPAPAGVLALFAYVHGDVLAVDALPAVALEIKRIDAHTRDVRAVATSGEATTGPMSAVEWADGRVHNYIGEAFDARDAWAENLRGWLGLPPAPAQNVRALRRVKG